MEASSIPVQTDLLTDFQAALEQLTPAILNLLLLLEQAGAAKEDLLAELGETLNHIAGSVRSISEQLKPLPTLMGVIDGLQAQCDRLEAQMAKQDQNTSRTEYLMQRLVTLLEGPL